MNEETVKNLIAKLKKEWGEKSKVLSGKSTSEFYHDYRPDLELRDKKDPDQVLGFIDVVNDEDLKHRRFMLLENEWRVFGTFLRNKDLYIYFPAVYKEGDTKVDGEEFLRRYLSDHSRYLFNDKKLLHAFTYDDNLEIREIAL